METRFYDESYRQWGLFIRHRFVCCMTVSEGSAFGMIFSTATSKLKEWHQQYPGSGREFVLRLSSTPGVLGHAQKAMLALHDSYKNDKDRDYHFVKKLKLRIEFQDINTGQEQSLVCARR